MFAKTAIALALLVGTTSSVLSAQMHTQTPNIPDQKLNAVAATIRALTAHGLFAEEYDAILEVAQEDPQLREKIIRYMLAPPM